MNEACHFPRPWEGRKGCAGMGLSNIFKKKVCNVRCLGRRLGYS